MLQLVSLPRGYISIGIPLALNIYNAHGNRLLRKGEVIKSQEEPNRPFTEGILGRGEKILEETELASQSIVLSTLGDIQEDLEK